MRIHLILLTSAFVLGIALAHRLFGLGVVLNLVPSCNFDYGCSACHAIHILVPTGSPSQQVRALLGPPQETLPIDSSLVGAPTTDQILFYQDARVYLCNGKVTYVGMSHFH
jgi:hypothetical protein